MSQLQHVYDDGGREAAGFTGKTGDCVTRAITIASGADYRQVYDELFQATLDDRFFMRKLEARYGENARKHASPRTGVNRRIYDRYLRDHGWEWTATMGIGTGCQVHLREGELPPFGRLIVRLSRHLTTVLDGVIHDTFNPSRDGTRCVYGYYQPGWNHYTKGRR